MPALGMAQETGKILRWLKAEGEAVVEGRAADGDRDRQGHGRGRGARRRHARGLRAAEGDEVARREGRRRDRGGGRARARACLRGCSGSAQRSRAAGGGHRTRNGSSDAESVCTQAARLAEGAAARGRSMASSSRGWQAAGRTAPWSRPTSRHSAETARLRMPHRPVSTQARSCRSERSGRAWPSACRRAGARCRTSFSSARSTRRGCSPGAKASAAVPGTKESRIPTCSSSSAPLRSASTRA